MACRAVQVILGHNAEARAGAGMGGNASASVAVCSGFMAGSGTSLQSVDFRGRGELLSSASRGQQYILIIITIIIIIITIMPIY